MGKSEQVGILISALLLVVSSPDPLERLKRQLLYKSGTEVELNFVLTIPLNDPAYSISLGLFLEANYDLPPYNSQAIFTQPWQQLYEIASKNRRSSRAAIYRAVEGLFERVGRMPGRACLLRSICEAAAWPVDHDGLVGELMHTILTPSSTRENGPLHADYLAAEHLGRAGSVCGQYFASCPSTPLEKVSTLMSSPLPEIIDYF
ncbi:uncharacterized protein LOC132205116 [Neocloeon triangulifer]|uniref:uncharacterized protein LOC132205116 n=1 Tax=Neocloeon triangulifer TaxID=2078957 RepID=UPI00286F7AB8|nr:uncharacterized protein LOC132205116 [Neocloeon triangulifer]